MDPKIVLLRLKQNFDMSDSVTVSLDKDILSLAGRSTQNWLSKFKSDFNEFNGIGSLDISKMLIAK